MCAGSNFKIGKDDHSVFMGCSAASFDGLVFHDYGEVVKNVPRREFRDIMNKYTKEEIIEGLIDMLINSDE